MKILRGVFIFIFLFGCALYSIGQKDPNTLADDGAGTGQTEEPKAIVDYDAEFIHSVKVGDSTVMALVQDVILHHNGAILVCDSAVRYDENLFRCFGNVIISKNTTLIYGDRAEYDGGSEVARVFSELVKVVDEDAVLYAYDHMEFNTRTSVGQYTQKGTVTHKDNLMESVEAVYNSDERQVFFSKDVSVMNDEYTIRTDSMGYNFDTEITTFYKKAYIWNNKGNFLTADLGHYDRVSDTYFFTRNSYMMTETQQTWADTIVFNQTTEEANLFSNIQILDEEQSVLAFGDYGVYWGGGIDNAIITRNPSVIGFDPNKDQDSTFMRADTIFFYTIRLEEEIHELVDSLDDVLMSSDMLERERARSLEPRYEEGMDNEWYFESVIMQLDHFRDNFSVEIMPDLSGIRDSLSIEGFTSDSISTNFGYPDLIEEETGGSAVVKETVPLTKRQQRRAERQRRRAEKQAARLAKLKDMGLLDVGDKVSTLDNPVDSVDIALDSLPEEDWMDEYAEPQIDSIQRIIRAYNNVRIFREDLQAVCDSLVAFSVDSTAHMYINPLMWNNESQIISEIMHFYSKNQELDRAEFEGQPLVIEKISDTLYNQLSSREMEAYFINNGIDRLEAFGNAQSYYYSMDEETNEPEIFTVTESARIMFIFDDENQLDGISWKDDVTYSMYSMDQIPETQSQRMRGFKWEERRRPTGRYDVSDRSVRESVREEMGAIPKPEFTITSEIENYKQTLLEGGIWRDRNEPMWVSPDDFIR